jgi:hypothetical protein
MTSVVESREGFSYLAARCQCAKFANDDRAMIKGRPGATDIKRTFYFTP